VSFNIFILIKCAFVGHKKLWYHNVVYYNSAETSAIEQIVKTAGEHNWNCKEQEQHTLEQSVCWEKLDDDDDDENDSILRKLKPA
jgi:hypothetical protein